MSENNKKSSKAKKIKRNWHLFDAREESFGRMASKIAVLLRGKNKVSFTPYIDGGDFVVVVNSDALKYTGNKKDGKIYYRYSGYMGGMKEINLGDQIKKNSGKVIEDAVFGMLPKNKLRNEMMKRLKVYKDDQHPYGDKFEK
ncbi:MAG: 50S ribosomal protein L13 [Xanthomonadaceae bacterium]|nr:50S ribosomal protein L13 [Rhodospirillaceae bacterium]NIA18178.1 50S ribosomal protein L13 [Xanthomonadaceae bacterium]